MKIPLALSLLLITITTYSQKIGIDSKGKSIFTHLSRAEARLEFSSEEPLSVSYVFNPKVTDYILTATGDTTITKFSGLYGQISMLNSEDYLVVTNLSEMKPGLGLKFGWQKSIEVFKKIDMIPKNYKATYTTGFNAIFNMDNIMLYDSALNTQGKQYPVTYGIEGNLNFFFRNKNILSKKRIILALNASLLRTWNDDDLSNYQDISDVTVLPNIVALKEFKGRYGVLKDDVTKFRFSVSLPMYFSLLNPIPYVVYNNTSGTSSYNFGLFTNILNKSLPRQNFKIPSSFGFGIDWVYSEEKFSSANVFIKGAISIGEL